MLKDKSSDDKYTFSSKKVAKYFEAMLKKYRLPTFMR